jgi:type IV secretion system protein VirB5
MQIRASQIQDLMRQINSTQDAKSIQELSARIQSEQVMATNEAKEAEWLRSQIEMQGRAIDLAHKQRMLQGTTTR